MIAITTIQILSVILDTHIKVVFSSWNPANFCFDSFGLFDGGDVQICYQMVTHLDYASVCGIFNVFYYWNAARFYWKTSTVYYIGEFSYFITLKLIYFSTKN
jgi:hypothetical protein